MGYLTWSLFRITKEPRAIYYEPKTGLPYTYEIVQKKVYVDVHVKNSVDTKDIQALPERFRQFSEMNGNYLWPYFRKVDREKHVLEADVSLLLENFPTWENVKKSDELDEFTKHGWDEEKHNLFKECLEWCKEQGGFWGKWPY